jgi:hypothetical protein
MNYRIFWPTWKEATEITEAQRTSIISIAERFGLTDSIVIEPEFGYHPDKGAVFLRTDSMVFGIEPDGYAHT